ncbi:MAG TPA: DUF481 domain-containing protein [Polyangiaceae bacterium]|nr:DUF481 domain-containing protein [Polyangiaceae bacterium]
MKSSKIRLALATSLLSTSALAQNVSSGKTEVAAEGKEKATAVPAAIDDATELTLQGGGLLAGGNARSFALTTSGKFLLRRGPHEFNAGAAMNYAESVAPAVAPTDPKGPMNPTVENYQGRLRYDYFFDEQASGFFAVSARRDRFQGIDLRLGLDPGVSAYAIRNDEIKLWGELGYNFQFDAFNAEAQAARATLVPQPDSLSTRTDHNVRMFLGYAHRMDKRLSLDVGLEGFKSVVEADAWRLNFAAQLTTQLFERFSFAVGAVTLYNNFPGVPGIEKLDVTSSMSFVYQLL